MRTCDGAPPLRSRPYQYSTMVDTYQRPPMFNAMPSVYCRGPSHPGGVTSGQRPAPWRFENSTWNPPELISIESIVVVIGQLAKSLGEFRSVAWWRSMPSLGPAGVGSGAGGGGAGAGVGV